MTHSHASSRVSLTMVILAGTVLFAAADPATASPVIKLYVLAGQSNAMGQSSWNSQLPAELQAPQDNVPIYYNGSWQSLQPGMGVSTDNFGPELMLGHDLAAAMPSQRVGLIKYAIGSTTLAKDWKAGATAETSGPLYVGLLQTIQNAWKSLDASYQPEISGVSWMQGESDGLDGYGNQYEANLKSFITQLRTDLGDSDLRFGVGEILPIWSNSALIRQAQVNVGMSMANVEVFDTADLTTDIPGHFDTASALTLGSRFASTMVPEPTSVVSLGLAIGWLGLWMACRRRRTS